MVNRFLEHIAGKFSVLCMIRQRMIYELSGKPPSHRGTPRESPSKEVVGVDGVVNGVGDSPPKASPRASPSTDASSKLRIVGDLEAKIVSAGESMTLECQLEGSPSEVTWLRNGKEIKPSAAAEVESAGSTYRLKLPKCAAEDSGTYQCEARSGSTSVSTTATMLVIGKRCLLSDIQ